MWTLWKLDQKYLESFEMWRMGKDRKDHLDRSCEKWKSVTKSQGGEEYLTHNIQRKINWISHILRRNYLLKHVVHRKIEERVEVAGRRGRRRKQLVDGLMENRGYWKSKEEALNSTLWRTGFGRVCWHIARLTTEWMKFYLFLAL